MPIHYIYFFSAEKKNGNFVGGKNDIFAQNIDCGACPVGSNEYPQSVLDQT